MVPPRLQEVWDEEAPPVHLPRQQKPWEGINVNTGRPSPVPWGLDVSVPKSLCSVGRAAVGAGLGMGSHPADQAARLQRMDVQRWLHSKAPSVPAPFPSIWSSLAPPWLLSPPLPGSGSVRRLPPPPPFEPLHLPLSIFPSILPHSVGVGGFLSTSSVSPFLSPHPLSLQCSPLRP